MYQKCTAMQNTEGWMWIQKTDVNDAKVQTTAKYIKFDAWARTGTNRCNAKTDEFVYLWYKFHSNKNWIFVAIYGIQKSKAKTCFSQDFKSKNVVSIHKM